jgi:small RNA 2'-O-methyltransferase
VEGALLEALYTGAPVSRARLGEELELAVQAAEAGDAGSSDEDPLDEDPMDAYPVDAEPVDAEPVDTYPVDARWTRSRWIRTPWTRSRGTVPTARSRARRIRRGAGRAVSWPGRPVLGWRESSTPLHEERLDAVMAHLGGGVETVLDLGCGSGALLERLVGEAGLRRIVGVDSSALALRAAEGRLTSPDGTRDERLTLRHGSVTAADDELAGFDAAVLVETLEHLEPGRLSELERSLFGALRPGRVLITTPNREYNELYGLDRGELRHPHHRFEWDRSRFESWATGVGRRNGYAVAFEGVGAAHAWLGSPTQMAVFRRLGE